MAKEWHNWSGSVRFKPEKLIQPKNEEQVRQLVLQALATNKKIRIAGSGHSSVPLVETDQLLVSLVNMKGLTEYQEDRQRAKMLPGTAIHEAGDELIKLNLSMHNTGDIDRQMLAGAFGTGTHGSGRTLQNLPAMLVGCRLVDGRGELQEFTLEEQPDMIQAARLALGSLGIFTELTLQLEPALEFDRREYCSHFDTAMAHVPQLIAENRMFDMYWYPRSDEMKLRTCNPVGEGMQDLPFAEKVNDQTGYLYEILPKVRHLRFEEMEYALPFDAGLDCYHELRKRIRAKHRQYVGWRVFFRTVAADDAFLSPFYKRDSVTIAVLQNNILEYKKYFADIEPIFRDYGGRPHWGKKHTLQEPDLKPLYPEWEKFQSIRQQLDPDGLFVNDYLKGIFGL